MKTTKTVLALVIALAGITLAESALAGGYYRGGYRGYYGPRVTVGFGFGYPYGYGYGYGYPYYAPYAYYPPYASPVVVQQQPVTYVEQPAQQVQSQQPQYPAGYWYYCNDSGAYYPYVKECPAGWQRVSPQPEQ